MTDAFIYDAIRSPRGKGRADGALHEVTAVRLSALMLDAIKVRSDLDTRGIEDVICRMRLRTVDEISINTNAGSGCGSCRMLIQEILDSRE